MTHAAPDQPDIRFHTVVGLATAATALGLSRFGYSVLLPAMRDELGWSYATAGALNTANALGYLLGALISPLLLRQFARVACLRASATLTALSLLACAATERVDLLMALRTLGGASAAVLFVAGGLLAAQLADASSRPGLVLGVFYAGVGPGILLSSLLAPAILLQPTLWRLGWVALGAATVGCAIAAIRSATRIPPPHPTGTTKRQAAPPPSLRWAAVAFTLYGLGYIPFMTFVVAYWRDSGESAAIVTSLWALLAIAATASSWLFRDWLDTPQRALVRLLALVTVGAALPLLSTHLAALGMSSAMFGAGFLAVTAAITQLIRHARTELQRPRTLAVFTCLFAGGQICGPVLTGWLADHLGLRGGLAVAIVLLVIATLTAIAHQRATQPARAR